MVFPMSGRRFDIDTLRGLACFLLVGFHVVGAPDAGLRLPESHWLSRLNDVLAYLRMPLFSVISGYVYAARPLQDGAGRFVRGKMRRLLLPLLTVGTVFAVIQRLMPGTNDTVEDWRLIHIQPVGHFWFLEALFLIFLVLVLLERTRALASPQRFAGVFALSVLVFLWVPVPDYFAASGAVYLMPFFLAGLACKRFGFGSARARKLAGVVLLGASAWLLMHTGQGASETLAGLTLSLSLTFLLLHSGWHVRWLALIGAYSFPIYLLHVFFTAGSRIAFSALGVSDPVLLFALGLAAGVLGPMVAALVIRRSAQLRLWLLGEVPKRLPAQPTSSAVEPAPSLMPLASGPDSTPARALKAQPDRST